MIAKIIFFMTINFKMIVRKKLNYCTKINKNFQLYS